MNPVIEPTPLPEGLAGPLHFPSPSSWSVPMAVLLVAAVLLWQLWRRLRRRGGRGTEPTRREPAAPPTGGRIVEALGDLFRRHLAAGTYRRGCHELSQALRSHWESSGLSGAGRPRLTRLTAREVQQRVGDRPATRLLALISDLQFGRREPSGDDFRGAYELSVELVSRRKGE